MLAHHTLTGPPLTLQKHALRLPARAARTARLPLQTYASDEAARMLVDGKKKFEAGDRMGALKLWEQALKQDPDLQQRQVALFNATAVHSSFGDVELAQITLREAVQRGLDFTRACQDPAGIDPSMVKLKASQQILIRLRKFDEATKKAMGAAAAPPQYAGGKARKGGAAPSSSSTSARPAFLSDDVSEMLTTDMEGIDTSILGIVKRVAVLLVGLSALGVGLYYVGIQYLFPPDM